MNAEFLFFIHEIQPFLFEEQMITKKKLPNIRYDLIYLFTGHICLFQAVCNIYLFNFICLLDSITKLRWCFRPLFWFHEMHFFSSTIVGFLFSVPRQGCLTAVFNWSHDLPNFPINISNIHYTQMDICFGSFMLWILDVFHLFRSMFFFINMHYFIGELLRYHDNTFWIWTTFELIVRSLYFGKSLLCVWKSMDEHWIDKKKYQNKWTRLEYFRFHHFESAECDSDFFLVECKRWKKIGRKWKLKCSFGWWNEKRKWKRDKKWFQSF